MHKQHESSCGGDGVSAAHGSKHADAAAAAAAVAELAWDGETAESVFALVREPAHVHVLTHEWRLVGTAVDREADVLVCSSPPPPPPPPTTTTTSTHSSRDTEQASGALVATPSKAKESTASAASSATMLRLRLEEIYVGLYHGFLTLQHRELDTDAFKRALLDAVHRPNALASEAIGPAKQLRLVLSPTQATRLRVFRDLWTRGYVVAFGSKFSSELLIYEGAPAQSHATALVLVRAFDAPFHVVDIVSHCRVAKMVKKQVFFASCEPAHESTSHEGNCAGSDSDTNGGHGATADRHSNDVQTDGAVVYIAINHALLATRQEM